MRLNRWLTGALAIVVVLSLLLSACQSAPAPSAPAKAEAPSAPAPAKAAEAPKAAEPAKPAEAKPAEAPKAEAKPAAKETYKIGGMFSLTGPIAAIGIEFRDSVVLEVDRINAAGGVDGHQIEMVIEDDGFDPTKGATALTKLIRQDKVLAVLGPLSSALEAAVRPVTEREQVPQILGHPTSAEMRAKKLQWSFNTAFGENVTAAGILDILKDKGYKKVIAVAEAAPVYMSMVENLKADAAKEGIEVVVLADNPNPKDVDVTPIATKLKDLAAKEKPQALVMATTLSGVPLAKTMKSLGMDLPMVGANTFGMQAYVDMAGDTWNGILFPASKILAPDKLPDADPQKAVILDFLKRYKAKTGKDLGMGVVTAGAPDAANILFNALKAGGSDKAKLRDAIEKTKNFVGVSGMFNYTPDDHEGLTKQSLAVYEIKDKKFSLVRAIK